MKTSNLFGIVAGAALLAATPLSLEWSAGPTPLVSLDVANARVGRPLTPMSVAGVHRRAYRRGYGGWGAGVGIGVGAAALAAGAAAASPYYGYSGYGSPYYGYSGYSYPYSGSYAYYGRPRYYAPNIYHGYGYRGYGYRGFGWRHW
jgi:hypothetical protein